MRATDRAGSPKRTAFKVFGHNIREGGNGRLADIADAIRAQHPDAVALLEAMSPSNAERLARELRMELAFGEANNAVHVAWLSRLPIRRAKNHRLADLSKTLLEVEVLRGGAPLRLFATHLASRHDAQSPAEEVPVILGVLNRNSDEPHLLLGDFNALRPGDPVGTPPRGVEKRGEAREGVPRRAIRQILDAGYTDCYRTMHPREPGYTYPSSSPWLRLDYVFASPRMADDLRACDVVIGETAERASDHLPIWAEFG